MRVRTPSVGLRIGGAVAAVVMVASGCTADPPPPIESAETSAFTTPPAAPATTGNPVVVAVDDVGTGFNPHLLADQSPANLAVSSLVLPSPFLAVADPADPQRTQWVPDESLLVSAEVISEEPFTVEYRLRNTSQWSDGAPIAAEDFVYLWQQMITEPGVVDSAGYAAIDNVLSTDGGKTVRVVMNQPYPAWRQLFSSLLPSHLLKDSPGGFERGLRDNVPVSGNRFRIEDVDRGRDEVLLERNDRYWGEPATPDEILLRRAGTDAQAADSLRSGDAQVVEIRGGATTLQQLGAIPDVRTDTRLRPRALELTLNGRSAELSDVDVRRGVLGLLDVELLSRVAAGSGAFVEPTRAQVLTPSQPGYEVSAPEPLGREESLARLASAGYTPVPLPPALEPSTAAATTTTAPSRSGTPSSPADDALTLVIGAPETDTIALAVANTAADQLRAAGIDARVAPTDPQELYGTALQTGEVDAVVGWTHAGSDPATALSSRFGCDGTEFVPGAATTEDSSIPGTVSPRNISGICDPSLEPSIAAAMRGDADGTSTVLAAQDELWNLAVVLPIVQDASVVATGPGVTGVGLSGPVEAGIYGDADQWTRQTR